MQTTTKQQLATLPADTYAKDMSKVSSMFPQVSSKVGTFTNTDKAALAVTLGRVCASVHTYGKSADHLGEMVEGFVWALEGVASMQEILCALKVHARESGALPTPHSLKKIIDMMQSDVSPSEYDSAGVEILSPEDEKRNAEYFRS